MTAQPRRMTDAEFTQWLDALTETLDKSRPPVTEQAPPPAAPVVEEAPSALHELSEDQWQEQRAAYWTDRLPKYGRGPQTIADLTAGREDDGAA